MKRRRQSKSTHINMPKRIHINELPNDLVVNILARLPIQDAVRTSILSRKWRYAWTELPCLVFDDRFCEETTINSESKIIMAIYQALLLHHGPLCEFKLSLSNLDSSCSQIDQFVLAVLKKGVKVLILYILKGEPYILPSSIFAYGQQLERLELCYCAFIPPSGFNGFSKLDRLVLEDVSISGGRLSSLIANCPLLKRLNFRSTTCDRVDIVAPNLEFFSFECLCKRLYFKNTPKLATVEIYTGNEFDDELPEASSQSVLCGRLPVVEELELDNFYMQMASRAPRSLVNDLRHLKTLSLWYTCFRFLDEVFSALSLIRNSQNLENLTIAIHAENTLPDVEFKEVEGFSDVTLDRLRMVELQNVSGSKCELQFIKLVLAKSPVLEKFIVEPDSNLVGDKGCKFFKEFSRFRRASPLVEITYEV